jgi:hypothetical protein
MGRAPAGEERTGGQAKTRGTALTLCGCSCQSSPFVNPRTCKMIRVSLTVRRVSRDRTVIA